MEENYYSSPERIIEDDNLRRFIESIEVETSPLPLTSEACNKSYTKQGISEVEKNLFNTPAASLDSINLSEDVLLVAKEHPYETSYLNDVIVFPLEHDRCGNKADVNNSSADNNAFAAVTENDEDHASEEAVLEYRLAHRFGYPMKEYTVTTKDKYYLTLYRIPPNKEQYDKKRFPILLVHGLSGSSETFLTLGKGKAPAFYFHDRGYDVWLMNMRGNRHGRKHKSLDADMDKEFWNFDLSDIGIYDIPANIDFILNITKQEKLTYIGHSQGTTEFFITMSELPEYNEKLLVGVQLGPSALRRHFRKAYPVLYYIASSYPAYEEVLNELKIYEVLPSNEEFRALLEKLCKFRIIKPLCLQFLYLIGGQPSLYFNNTLLKELLTIYPAGSSVKCNIHYFQQMTSGRFCKYDYGPTKNLKLYNSTIPPEYDLTKITAPVMLIHSPRDWFSEHEIEEMTTLLRNVIWVYEPAADYNHIDFILANNVVSSVYDPLYERLKKLEENVH